MRAHRLGRGADTGNQSPGLVGAASRLARLLNPYRTPAAIDPNSEIAKKSGLRCGRMMHVRCIVPNTQGGPAFTCLVPRANTKTGRHMSTSRSNLRRVGVIASLVVAVATGLTACSSDSGKSDASGARSEKFDQALHDKLPKEIRDSGKIVVGGAFESLPLLNTNPADATKPVGVAPLLTKAMSEVLGVDMEFKNTAFPGQLPRSPVGESGRPHGTDQRHRRTREDHRRHGALVCFAPRSCVPRRQPQEHHRRPRQPLRPEDRHRRRSLLQADASGRE